MEKLSDKARGYALIKVVGAQPTALINAALQQKIEIWGTYPEDELTLTFKTRLTQAEQVTSLAGKCYCDVEILERRGAPMKAKQLRRRYVLWALPLLLLLLQMVSTLFIWKIDVSGNDKVTEIQILAALKNAEVEIGTFKPSLQSSRVDNLVIAEIPELKWVSTSLFGSRLRVDVRERTEIPKLRDEHEAVKVVANQAGLITKMETLWGFPRFKAGQTADKGETLIDGLVPGSYGPPRIVHAQGTVLARTWYEICGILPLEYSEKRYVDKPKSKFALIWGDNRINFYSNSRILQGKCDNIICEYNMGVEGLFSLPLTLVRQESRAYELESGFHTEAEASARLEASLAEELKQRIGKEGEIVSANFSFSVVDGVGVGTLRAECKQNIAAEKKMSAEEIAMADIPKEEASTNDRNSNGR